MNTSYTFYKDGKKYSSKGANRFEAQENLELQWRMRKSINCV